MQHLQARFVAVQHGVVQQLVAHQVEQRLQLLATLDHPTRQGLAWDVDAVAAAPLKKVGRRRALEGLRVPLWSVLSFACTALVSALSSGSFAIGAFFPRTASLVMLFDHSKLRMI
ncbi:hypothetical protein PK34_05900 [Stutzerimonas stutzeri]|nr:hypothetical protein PK34_05900 [Stutzerimonas stutzeri]